MKYRTAIAAALLLSSVAASSTQTALAQDNAGWITLLNLSNLDNWNRVGNANWMLTDGALQANYGGGHLVTKEPYGDFQIRAEIWVDPDANSGIFIRCMNGAMPGADSCYEVNIYDKRPGQGYATGAIVNVGPVRQPPPLAGNRWNVLEITARGPQLTVTLNGEQTVNIRDMKFARGPFTLQYGAGMVKFRDIKVRPL